MKARLFRLRKGIALTGLVAVALMALAAQPALAIFGFGDVVFDPTSYATLGHIWEEDISTGAKLIQEINQLTKIYTNGYQLYSHAVAMSQSFNGAQKGQWMTIAQTAVNDYTRDQYGETVAWPLMVNGHPELAPRAWANATVAVTPNPYLASHLPGNSPSLASLATIEAMDGSGSKCLATVAQYRSVKAANSGPWRSLFGAIFDATAQTNSQIQQLNLLNASSAQAAQERQAQGDIHACEVEQQALANKVQRDALANHMNFLSQVDQYTVSESGAWGGSAQAISSYRGQ